MPLDDLAAGAGIQECELCRNIVGAAERHFQNNVTTQDGLKRELDRECIKFSHTHDKNVSQQCINYVDANIATIFTEISQGKRPEQICTDILVCAGRPTHNPPTAAVKIVKKLELPQHDPCNTCTFIVGRAEHHFRPNETESQLQKTLDGECRRLGQFQGQQAADHCLKIIDSHMDIIYNDIKAGKRPHQICIDIGECTTGTASPVPVSVSPGL
uniref:Saposin B-type domain-containing protein n=1 Tax=Panagrolaimus sp. JU765 TaxID=591449 RepID=A0AC34R2E9_9BILA